LQRKGVRKTLNIKWEPHVYSEIALGMQYLTEVILCDDNQIITVAKSLGIYVPSHQTPTIDVIIHA
jgi:hypothetical protein